MDTEMAQPSLLKPNGLVKGMKENVPKKKLFGSVNFYVRTGSVSHKEFF